MSDKIIKERLSIIPNTVWEIIASYGWLVGSGAKYLVDEDISLENVNDWDIIISLNKLRDFQKQLRSKEDVYFSLNMSDFTQINNFGGYQFCLPYNSIKTPLNDDEMYCMDVWPHNLEDYLKSVPDNKPTLAININPPIICNKTQVENTN